MQEDEGGGRRERFCPPLLPCTLTVPFHAPPPRSRAPPSGPVYSEKENVTDEKRENERETEIVSERKSERKTERERKRA